MAARHGAGAGPLEAGQVRAMFDRIAGVYDLMNTAMTAGLHHRWRERAADLARVGPGSRVLDVATGTGDLAIELARASAPGGEVIGCDFSEAMLDRARTEGRAPTPGSVSRASSGPTRWRCPTPTRQLRRGDGRLRRAQLRRPRARPRRDGARRAPRRAGRGARDHDARRAPPLSCFYRVWFDRVVPRSGALAGAIARARGVSAQERHRRRLHLPAELGQALSRAPPSWPARWTRGLTRDQLRAHGRRDHRHPRRHRAASRHERGRHAERRVRLARRLLAARRASRCASAAAGPSSACAT